MPAAKPRVLYVTDLGYDARGRVYHAEDIDLSARLRPDFTIALCHPHDVETLMPAFDAVVVRNSGPVMGFQREYDDFRAAAIRSGALIFNSLDGRGDMAGKQYLLDLTVAGYRVIPTIERAADLDRLPEVAEYVVKPKDGADSHGLEFVTLEGLQDVADGVLIQPRIDFDYEVSFYYVDDHFQYALYAPDTEHRWKLQRYEPTSADLKFASRFVEWNTLTHGITRVDACRAPDGSLLLVELEDLNPYLSLEVLDPQTRDDFVAAMGTSLRSLLASGQ
ncbi:hypothetical protein CLV47_1275 [Antricoccus suffuscus]|uniref:Glutathione synthase/RimK-type ligase-like ATP-grasp enzyme n=1 Tax=Antricoccus suffuscus TaxID=1629062 RepID=A0A2T0Z5P4_9ACTN|nr:hypothetical protein [Antricoccus suffuscus]PRZ31670.1 hypothetical protein CLV47_1275 [Antricoccus suffuscus]